MKKWKTALPCVLLLAGLVLLLIHPIRELTESLWALRAAASGGEAAGNAVLVRPVIAAAALALLPILLFLIGFLFSFIGRNKRRGTDHEGKGGPK